MDEKEDIDRITQSIIGAAILVPKVLGPGLLASAYDACLTFDLGELGTKIEKHKSLPLVNKTILLDCAYRLDLLVEDKMIVEVNAVDQLLPIHQAQALSSLKISGC
jgi:GxxExxY protein